MVFVICLVVYLIGGWLEHLAGGLFVSVQAKRKVVVLTSMVVLLWKERNGRLHGKGGKFVKAVFFILQRDSNISLMRFAVHLAYCLLYFGYVRLCRPISNPMLI